MRAAPRQRRHADLRRTLSVEHSLHEGLVVPLGRRPNRAQQPSPDPYAPAQAAMAEGLSAAVHLPSGIRPVVLRPAPRISTEDAALLIPQSVEAMVLALADPLELRTIENLRLLTAAGSAALARGDPYPQIILITTADVGLLNVVVGQDLDVVQVRRAIGTGEVECL